MNILIFSWRDPKHPLAGGAEQSVWEHAKGWLAGGHKITWFASKFRGSLPGEIVDGIQIVRRGSQYLGVQISAAGYFLKNRKKYDLIIDQFHGIPFFTPLYTKKAKIALIQEIAGKVWFLNPLPLPFNWLVGLLGYLTEPLIFKLYRKTPFLTASESAKKDVIGMGIPGKNVFVIPHGVIPPKGKIAFRKSRLKTISYLGILSKDKGIEDAIKCFQILGKRKDYQFWVIGKGETKGYEEKIKKLAKSLGKKVTFWGYVSESKKFELLAKSHLLINPSAHEGWGLVNIEANLVGTPVVAYKSAGLTDSVKENQSGVLCRENSPQELAGRVENLLNSGAEYSRLSKGARKWAEKFDWDTSRRKSLWLIKMCTSDK